MTSGSVSTGTVACGNVNSTGTVTAPQLYASNTLDVRQRLGQPDDQQQQRPGQQRPRGADGGEPERPVFLSRGSGAHQCELIMLNDEALLTTKSLSTQLSPTATPAAS